MTTNCSSGPAGRSEGWEMMLHADGNSLLYDCTAVFLRNTPTQDRPPQPPTRPSEAEGGRSGEKCCVNPNTVSQRNAHRGNLKETVASLKRHNCKHTQARCNWTISANHRLMWARVTEPKWLYLFSRQQMHRGCLWLPVKLFWLKRDN